MLTIVTVYITFQIVATFIMAGGYPVSFYDVTSVNKVYCNTIHR